MIKIELEGNPIAWARPGIVRTKKTNIVYDRQRKEKEQVRWQIRGQIPGEVLTTPMKVRIIFRMPIPKSTTGPMRREMLNGCCHHSKKPDIDNLQKFILDTMNGLVFKDDSQICSITADKIYSESPGTLIHIYPHSRNNNEEKEEVYDGYNFRDDGPGDVLRSCLDKQGHQCDTRKKDSVIPFSDG